MITRAQLAPGLWVAVPVLSLAPGPPVAALAYLHITATTFRDVHYAEHRNGRATAMRCSPEFQSRCGAEGVAVAVGQVPAGIAGR